MEIIQTINPIIIRTNLIEKLATHKSEIHGLGLFAKSDIRKHDLVWYEEFRGKYEPKNESPLRWTNHSYEPNSILLVNNIDEILKLSLVSLKEINSGEEITYNYNNFGHEGYSAACNCRSEYCPGSFTLRNEWGEK